MGILRCDTWRCNMCEAQPSTSKSPYIILSTVKWPRLLISMLHYCANCNVTVAKMWRKKCHILAAVTPLRSHVASCDIGHWTCDDFYWIYWRGYFTVNGTSLTRPNLFLFSRAGDRRVYCSDQYLAGEHRYPHSLSDSDAAVLHKYIAYH